MNTTQIGKLCENIVSSKLIKSGLNNCSLPYGFPFDLYTSNDIRIEVKRGSRDGKSWKVWFSEGNTKDLKKKGLRTKTHYKHGNRFYKDYSCSSDFIICHIPDTNDFYIIPSIIQKDKGRFTLNPSSKISKYNRYLNNWRLLNKNEVN